jgi:hypothetical protein
MQFRNILFSNWRHQKLASSLSRQAVVWSIESPAIGGIATKISSK